MSLIVVDVEADGPIPPDYSMVCFGAVIVDEKLNKTFYGETAPISPLWRPDALAVSGFSRESHETFPDPKATMVQFGSWIRQNTVGRPVFISDNPCFDFQWINYYFHKYTHENPFGYSGRRIGDLYCGMRHNMGLNHEWKRKLRKTKHNHDPVQDCLGNAEALLAMFQMGLQI